MIQCHRCGRWFRDEDQTTAGVPAHECVEQMHLPALAHLDRQFAELVGAMRCTTDLLESLRRQTETPLDRLLAERLERNRALLAPFVEVRSEEGGN